MVRTGRMDAAGLEANEAVRLIPKLEAFRRVHHRLRCVFLVLDGGASPIADESTRDFVGCGGESRPRLVRARGPRPNRGEILEHAFGLRDSERGSWAVGEEYVAHVMASWPESNRLHVHPVEWTRMNQKSARPVRQARPLIDGLH